MTLSRPLDSLHPLRRRRVLARLAGASLAAGLLSAGCPRIARATPAMAAEPFPDGATLLVAGPAGSPTDQWAALLAPVLTKVLPGGPRLRRALSGGADGVTGANQFDARADPDGTTALLLPGAAARSWLVGDPRAHFDLGPWVPVFAALTSAVFCLRPPGQAAVTGTLASSGGMATAVGGMRIAASSPVGAELPALLGLELLGAEPTAVFGVLSHEHALERLAQNAVDGVFVQGRDAPRRVAALAAQGAVPLFSIGAMDDQGRPMRDPSFPDVPHFAELYAQLRSVAPAGALFTAWSAAAVAAQLDAALVLPAATPAAMVALWRRGGDLSLATPTLQLAAAAMPARPVGTGGAAMVLGAIATDAPALLELRSWLAQRFGWRPA